MRSLGIEDGLSHATVYCILQDRHGFMWFGTQNGLNRYDGLHIVTYEHGSGRENALNANGVSDMVHDGNGGFWLGTWGGGLDWFDPGTETFVHHEHDPLDPTSLSHNEVQTLLRDSRGRLWIGTSSAGLNRYRPEDKSFDRMSGHPGLDNARIWSLAEDARGSIWAGTDEGIFVLDENDRVTHYDKAWVESRGLTGARVRALMRDNQGAMWLGGEISVARVDSETGEKLPLPFPPNQSNPLQSTITAFFQDRDDAIWIGTLDEGLFRLTPPAEGEEFWRVRLLNYNPSDSNGLTHNDIRSLHQGHGGILWVGTRTGGLNLIDLKTPKFELYHIREQDPFNLALNRVNALYPEAGGPLWVGTLDGLARLDSGNAPPVVYRHDKDDPTTISGNRIRCILEDARGSLWIGTFGNGLNRMDVSSGTFTRYLHDPEDPDSISGNTVLALLEDEELRLWVATYNGLCMLPPDREAFVRCDGPDEVSIEEARPRYNSVIRDRADRLWLGTYESGISRYEPKTGIFTRFIRHDDGSESLASNRIASLHQDREGRIWIGTYDGGLSMLANPDSEPGLAVFRTYQARDGLPNNTVFGILSEDTGVLWVSTDRGLCRFDPKEQTFRRYDPSDGLQGYGFNPRAVAISQDGYFYFGGNRGFNRFQPREVADNPHVPPVHIMDFRVQNQSRHTGLLDPSRHLQVNYDDTMVTFAYVALDYTVPEKNRYAYKLENFDRDWIDADHRTEVTYTNLHPGTYRFRVRATNNDGVWNEAGTSVMLTVIPPPWQTWWAYGLYVFALFCLVLASFYYQKQKLRSERAMNKGLRQLDKLKDEFLASTSHELRTPLNGMIGIVQSLLDGVAGDLSDRARANLKMVRASGTRLVNLVSDIMDFSKLKNQSLDLNLRGLDLRAATDVVLTILHPLVSGKDVALVNAVEPTLPPVRADEDRLQQILINLVANGIKFTESGHVRVSAKQRGGTVEIRVSDTGVGMNEEKLDTVFDTHESGTQPGVRVRYGGSLGLAITKRLVELHGGRIEIDSSEGVGTTVLFTLPIGEAGTGFYTVNELIGEHTDPSLPMDAGTTTGGEDSDDREPGRPRRFHVLIVEDESLNRRLMANHLTLMGYRVTEMVTGTEAIRALQNGQKYDLVLLDVIMPRMSGYEVCRKIREMYAVQDLPVIFLAAKHQISDVVAGFESGGNDYITKPISKDELVSRINTHISLLDTHRNLELKVVERTRELAARNSELESLDDIVKAVNREMELNQVLETLLHRTMSLFSQAERATFLVWEPDDEVYRFAASVGYVLDDLRPVTFTHEELVTHDVDNQEEIEKGIYVIRDCEDITIAKRLRNMIAPRSMLVMTVAPRERLEGVLVLINNEDHDAFDAADAHKLNRFREHAIAAISKARVLQELRTKNDAIVAQSEELRSKNQELREAYRKLEEVSLTDPLTGLRNRRFLVKHIHRDVHKVLRDYSEPGADTFGNSDMIFFLLDVDHFKMVNDNHGHAAGDRVLVQIAEILVNTCRQSDIIVRWGGEEFLVVSRFTNRENAPDVAERIRSTVEKHHFSIGGGDTVRRTCSIGFACLPFLSDAPGTMSWEQVVDIADHALYAAKRSGRNAWVGVAAAGSDHRADLFKGIREDLEGCKEAGEVEILSSLELNSLVFH
ncbi:Diguanylate cyclase [Sulfidibacter corallicola]|uniref:histidine kinase n=1 Tax=Sulfidibacter corallicola TaxID=2818388 RepID=A0A8A4TCT2_SULCO|nr:two-component regulator propeller domain-containing protein [Sulfidibacter corallicola]QTD47909.1 diguanylate cyclase [Sulfidibacter corallicola]